MKYQKGFGIIEVIVAMAIFTTIAVVGVTTVVGSFSTNRLGNEETKATIYAQEGIEAVRSIKNQGWTTPFLATSCASGCGVEDSGGSWEWSGLSNTLGDFTRTITILNVQRDENGNIVESGGTSDPDTKKVISEVSWDFSPSRNNTLSLATYLTHFNKSIVGDWSSPQVQSSLDLTSGNSGAGNTNALSVAYANGYVYLGRNASGGTEIFAIDVSNLGSPTLCASCQRELGGDVNDIEINGNYAYIASSNNSQELQILNISSPTSLNTASLTTFDLTNGNSGSNNVDAVAIAISGNNLYMARNGGDEFIQFNISTPTSPSITGTNADFDGTPSDMVIVGNYAYITSNDNNAELQVFNLTTLARVAVLNLNSGNNNANALSLVYAGNNMLLLGRSSSGGAPELYSINIETPTSPSVASTLEIGDDVTDVSFGNNLIFLAVQNNSTDFMVINGSNLNSLPALPPYGEANIADSPQDILYELSLDRVFSASSNNSAEFEIIEPN